MLSIISDTEVERKCVLLCPHCRTKHAVRLVCVNRKVLLVQELAVGVTRMAYVDVKLFNNFLLMLSLSVLEVW